MLQRKVEWALPLAILQGAHRSVTVAEMVLRIQEAEKKLALEDRLGREPRDFHQIGQKLRPILYRLRKNGYIHRETLDVSLHVDFRSAPWAISGLGSELLQNMLAEMAEVKRLAET